MQDVDVRPRNLGETVVRSQDLLLLLLVSFDLGELMRDDFNVLVCLVEQRIEKVHLPIDQSVGLLLHQVSFHRLPVVQDLGLSQT